MESLITQGLIHTYGTLLWIAAITVITVELFRAFRKEEAAEFENRWSLRLLLMALITTTLTGSTGLFFLYEWEIWNSLSQWNFWWVHAMILVWILFSMVFFLLDPLLLKRLQ